MVSLYLANLFGAKEICQIRDTGLVNGANGSGPMKDDQQTSKYQPACRRRWQVGKLTGGRNQGFVYDLSLEFGASNSEMEIFKAFVVPSPEQTDYFQLPRNTSIKSNLVLLLPLTFRR